MSLSKEEEELFSLFLSNKGLSKSKWEKEQLEKATVQFLADFSNSKSPLKKEWNKKSLEKAKRQLITEETLNTLKNKGD